jgi:hypothetical protein
MRHTLFRPIPGPFFAALALAFVAGCDGARAYTPDSGFARKALESALSAWQNGSKPEQLAAATPSVNALDFQWQGGQALESFEVSKEEAGEGATKRFAVSLKLKPKSASDKKAASPVDVHYIVVGRDPVWVYRDEDYTRLLNMDNNPRVPPSRSSPKGGR